MRTILQQLKCIFCGNDLNEVGNCVDESYLICKKCDDKNIEDYKKAFDEMIDYENEIYRKDQRLLKAIKTVKGNSFYESLCKLIEDLDKTSNYSLKDKPTGNYQKEFWHKEIQGVWVDQFVNGGYEGDHFEGYVYVKIKRKNKREKYFKIPYSM